MEKKKVDQVYYRQFIRTAIMLLCKAICDVLGEKAAWNCVVDYTIAHAYFVRTKGMPDLDAATLQKIKERMQEMNEAGLPIVNQMFAKDKAMDLIRAHGMKEKAKLFRYRRNNGLNLCYLDGYYDYFYGPCLPDVSEVKLFDLLPEQGGFYFVLPLAEDLNTLPDFVPRPLLRKTLEESNIWYNQIGIQNIGDLNDRICAGDISDMILVQEAEQERKIGEIAKMITAREGVKFIMIAGPSSSGKTTFSHRLSIQLRTQGKVPHPIALDDYFVNRVNTPLDAEGKPNFECLEAIDVEQFNKDMIDLLSGKEVEMPHYNFKTGRREYNGHTLKLGSEDLLVIEGIHGLNDKLSHSLPIESKFKIYISALTSLNIDEHNRIPSTDNRLIRRMVRDARTRGTDASQTIQMWPSVRRGEEQNIFPFQEQADVMFNSALLYELAVLKQFAEPLLFHIPPEDPAYPEAERLLKFLDYFLGVSSESLPSNSVCREFVGGSCFRV
ncbi:MAG: nucleoside kinase [Lachnospiraceae bacterium]|nr:nucleoside kinase [Lachnospiraceae bacterium]